MFKFIRNIVRKYGKIYNADSFYEDVLILGNENIFAIISDMSMADLRKRYGSYESLNVMLFGKVIYRNEQDY